MRREGDMKKRVKKVKQDRTYIKEITLPILLEIYKELVNTGKIKFLEDASDRDSVVIRIGKLLGLIREAKRKMKERNDDNFGEYLNWHKMHIEGRELWHKLCSCALNSIDREAKGNSRLFEFLNAATDFEDLLYGLEPFYRDHTLHSLWVYFIGEHIQRNLLPHRHKHLDWYLINDIERERTLYKYSERLVDFAKKKEKKIIEKVNEHRDAMWCIIALCHDLGYSLAKIGDLNKKVEKVLEFFDIPDFRRFGYSLDIEHQYHVSQFLELMAMDVRIVPSESYKGKKALSKEDVLIKGYRDDETYWRLCRAFEEKRHGIISAYLIYKILGIFAESWMRSPAEQWGFDDEEAVDNLIRGDILFAIAQHEFEFSHLNHISSLADILILADELEEFSRYGRQLVSRQYYDTTADVEIEFTPHKPKQGEDIDITIKYKAKHKELKDFASFFILKAERLARTYSLERNRGRNREKGTIKSIKMTFQKDNEQLVFHLYRDFKKTYGRLPAAKFKGEANPIGGDKPVKLKCYDDKICYVDTKGDKKTLDEWFKNLVEHKKWEYDN